MYRAEKLVWPFVSTSNDCQDRLPQFWLEPWPDCDDERQLVQDRGRVLCAYLCATVRLVGTTMLIARGLRIRHGWFKSSPCTQFRPSDLSEGLFVGEFLASRRSVSVLPKTGWVLKQKWAIFVSKVDGFRCGLRPALRLFLADLKAEDSAESDAPGLGIGHKNRIVFVTN
jgi:hypothetical protein